jgi:hypothetical protein
MGTLEDLNKQILVIEEFLPNLKHYLTEIYKIPLYGQQEHNKKFNCKSTFPGKRSSSLYVSDKFLFFLILQNLKKISFLNKYNLDIYLHLRRQEDFFKDWIHKDTSDYAFLIYLNATNLNSGTYLYDEEGNIVSDIRYVQNRLVIYNGSYNHMGYGHFGDSCENGRLTLNGFLNIHK